MAKTRKTVTLDPDNLRVDLAVQALTGVSRASVRGLFDHGCVTLAGRLCKEPGSRGNPGQEVAVEFEIDRKYKEIPATRSNRAFRIAHEDAQLLVVEKAAGVLTVATDRREDDTLQHEVGRHLSKGQRITKRAWVVHRLDRDTSGLLVFGKTREIQEALSQQFEDQKPERQYAAIVAGRVREDRGTFRSFLVTAEDLDQYSTHVAGQGKLSITHYEVQDRLRDTTFVRVRLETGRRNQIRVHFAEAGHPVLGDVRYESERAKHPLWKEKRLALHAQTLGFRHPVTGAAVTVTSDLPAAFVAFLRANR